MFACLFFLMVEMMYTALVSRSDYVFFVKVVLHEGTMTFTRGGAVVVVTIII
jgi:hypothetical protein